MSLSAELGVPPVLYTTCVRCQQPFEYSNRCNQPPLYCPPCRREKRQERNAQHIRDWRARKRNMTPEQYIAYTDGLARERADRQPTGLAPCRGCGKSIPYRSTCPECNDPNC